MYHPVYYKLQASRKRRRHRARRVTSKLTEEDSLLFDEVVTPEGFRKCHSARERFQHAVKFVIILLKVFSVIKDSHEKEVNSKDMSFTEIAQEYESENMKKSGLHFDPKEFRANREVNISNEVKHVLSLPQLSRTHDQLQTALYGLQTMESFAEYPLHMQEKLTKVGWYEYYHSRKVIIRQGHVAENFYFIMAGSAVVKILETNPETGETKSRTATVLRKGSCFGEIALLHHSRRTATVSSQGPVQLLTIGREDFFDIFMRGQQPGVEAEHVTYLRQIPFLQNWPLEILSDHPEMCLLHYYKRGQVIIRDSSKSEWIYIVKSGTCEIMKELLPPSKQKGFENSTKSKYLLPNIAKKKTGKVETKVKFIAVNQTAEAAKNSSRHQSQVSEKRRNTKPFLPVIQEQGLESEKEEKTAPRHQFFLTRPKIATNDTLPSIVRSKDERRSSNASTTSTASTESETSFRRPNFVKIIETNSQFDSRKGAILGKPSYSESKFKKFTALKKSHQVEQLQGQLSPTKEIFMHSEYEAKRKVEKKGKPVFVKIEILRPRDVFGLNDIRFDEELPNIQPSLSLVSRGVECIMLRKSFFIKHANENVKKMLRHQIRLYPTTETFQDNLEDYSVWQRYKTKTIGSIIRNQNSKVKVVI